MTPPAFDIFSGRIHEEPLWLESVQGFSTAVERMQLLAVQKPGPYFIYNTKESKVVESIDTSKVKPPKHAVEAQYVHMLLFACPACALPVAVGLLNNKRDALSPDPVPINCGFCKKPSQMLPASARRRYVEEWPNHDSTRSRQSPTGS